MMLKEHGFTLRLGSRGYSEAVKGQRQSDLQAFLPGHPRHTGDPGGGRAVNP